MNENKLTAIGKAWIKDNEEIKQWDSSGAAKEFKYENWSEERAENWEQHEQIGFYKLQSKIPGLNKALDNGTDHYSLRTLIDKAEYYKTTGQWIDLIYLDDKNRFVILRSLKDEWLLPYRFVDIELYKNYDDANVAALNALTGESQNMLTNLSEVSVSDVKEKIQSKEQEILNKKQELDEIKKEQEQRIEEFKRKLEEEYRRQNELIEKKKAELEEKVRDLNNQLYMLETEIYAIRCITGEVVNFTKLTDGRNADAANPVVVYQKLRYLDEEMGKIMALYDFDGEDCRYFEELLKNRADIRDLFCPGDKAVTFVKVSKSGILYSASNFVANMLDRYEKYHGSTIGILIRDGENLYIGWTDEEKIKIHDDNVFFAPKQETVSQETEYARSTTRDEKISRFFIFSILQGLINDGKILKLPEKVQVMKPSPYIVFSMADGWIEDNTYGTWMDIVKATSGDLKKGDRVLTVQRITRDDANDYGPNSTKNQSYCNDRGRGNKNRTHDVSIADCTVYPINLIEKDEVYNIYYLQYPYSCRKEKVDEKVSEDGLTRSWNYKYHYTELAGPPELVKETEEFERGRLYPAFYPKVNDKLTEESVKEWAYWFQHYYRNDSVIRSTKSCYSEEEKYYKQYVYKAEHLESDLHIYISEEKAYCAGAYDSAKKMARANLEVFENELLNLTYLDSVRIRYAITNRKLGDWKIGGHYVDYAKGIKYLNVALSYVLQREEKEKEMLLAYTAELPDSWQVTLADWKREHGYHSLTDARANSFIKRLTVER